MNILRDSALLEKGMYQRAAYHFGFEAAWRAIQAGAPQYRFFKVEASTGGRYVTPIASVEFLHMLTTLGQRLPLAAKPYLLSLKEKHFFADRQKSALLCHLHLDWVLALASLKQDPQTEEALLEYLRLSAPVAKLEDKVRCVVQSKEERSTIYTFNKNSVLFDLEHPENNRFSERLFGDHVRLLRSCHILRHVEITEDFDEARLSTFLQEFKRASDLIVAKYPQALEHKVALKLRKIRRTLKKGMFVKATNTVLVDPRHTDSFWHELGHWVHSWLHPEMVDEAECEEFAEKFKKNLRE